MEVKWKRGFDKSDVTENNSISLAQFDYMVRFQEEYIEEIAAGQNMIYRGFFFLTFFISGEFPGVIMTIVLRRKIQYHLLQVKESVHPWMVNVNPVKNMQKADTKGQRGTQ